MSLVEYQLDKNGIASVQMVDRAGKNLFSDQLIDDLIRVIDRLEQQDRPRVVIISGLQDVFSGGASKESLETLARGELHVKDLLISERLIAAPFPIIAAMEGHAIGGGLIMAACCDIVLAAQESRYGAVFMNMGFTPGMGCTLLLEELCGGFIAREMMYTGRRFRGRELRSTNINYILPKGEIMSKSRSIGLQIAEKNPDSIYLLKYALSARRKKLLIDARLQEDLMHRISFAFPETRRTIERFYER